MAEIVELKFDTRMQCGGCGQMRDLHEWYWRKLPGPPYRRLACNVCKECRKKKQNEQQKQRYHNDPDWRAKYNEYQKAYREQNKGRVALMQKFREWRHKQKSPESQAQKSKRWYVANPGKRLWYAARDRAKRNAMEFSLSYEWVQSRLDAGRCELTGLPFIANHVAGRCSPFGPSIDRRDSSLGYTEDNCRLIVWGLNMALSEWGEEIYAAIANAYLGQSHGD